MSIVTQKKRNGEGIGHGKKNENAKQKIAYIILNYLIKHFIIINDDLTTVSRGVI